MSDRRLILIGKSFLQYHATNRISGRNIKEVRATLKGFGIGLSLIYNSENIIISSGDCDRDTIDETWSSVREDLHLLLHSRRLWFGRDDCLAVTDFRIGGGEIMDEDVLECAECSRYTLKDIADTRSSKNLIQLDRLDEIINSLSQLGIIDINNFRGMMSIIDIYDKCNYRNSPGIDPNNIPKMTALYPFYYDDIKGSDLASKHLHLVKRDSIVYDTIDEEFASSKVIEERPHTCLPLSDLSTSNFPLDIPLEEYMGERHINKLRDLAKDSYIIGGEMYKSFATSAELMENSRLLEHMERRDVIKLIEGGSDFAWQLEFSIALRRALSEKISGGIQIGDLIRENPVLCEFLPVKAYILEGKITFKPHRYRVDPPRDLFLYIKHERLSDPMSVLGALMEEIEKWSLRECLICRERHFGEDITNCGNCANEICIRCSKEWYSARPGGEVSPKKILCPFCMREPISLGEGHNLSQAIGMVMEDGIKYALCERCGKVAEAGRYDCQSGAVIEHFVCLTCRGGGKRCPRCDMPSELIDGCNHVICAMCNTHWCWRCGEAQEPDDIYKHMREMHGGIYN